LSRRPGSGDYVGVRESRSSPLQVVATDGLRAERDDLALADIEGSRTLVRVVVAPDQLLLDPALDVANVVKGRLVAVGVDHPLIRAALTARDASALAAARREAGSAVMIRSAQWSLDLARIDVVAEALESDLPALRDRLARLFRAEVRFEAGGQDGADPTIRQAVR
jgi:hypothetical protein